MTGRERVLAVLGGQNADHLPCMPITMMFAASLLGVRYEKYARDHNLLADGQLNVAEQFGLDHVSTISDPTREATDLGSRIKWYEDQPPAVVEDEALFADKLIFANIKVPQPFSGGRMEDRIRGIELLRRRVGQNLLVEGWVEGPCAEAADLRGINRLMTDFYDDPLFVLDLLAFTVEVATGFAEAQLAAGADIIGIGDAAASLVGPRIYNEFIWPWEKKLVDSIHAMGGRVRMHICGNTRPILEAVGRLGCELVDIDFPVLMELARSRMGREQALAGNIDPVRALCDGTPESVMHALEKARQQAGPRWIVAAGCEVVRDTPHQNLHAMVKFAQSHSAPAAAGVIPGAGEKEGCS